MTLSHQGFDRQLSAMLSRDVLAAQLQLSCALLCCCAVDTVGAAPCAQSQGIQNSQQLTGGYFHDNGPSPRRTVSQSAKICPASEPVSLSSSATQNIL